MPRSLDEEMTRRILSAAMDLVAERGFARVSMDAIARVAGVGKPALYRRFRDKPELVAAAISAALPAMEPVPLDPGIDVRRRLRALVEEALPEDPAGYTALIGDLMAEHRRHPELIAAFRERVLLPRRAVVRAAIEHGQQTGVLRADLDPELGVDMIGGAFLARAFAGLPMTRSWRGELFERWWTMAAA